MKITEYLSKLSDEELEYQIKFYEEFQSNNFTRIRQSYLDVLNDEICRRIARKVISKIGKNDISEDKVEAKKIKSIKTYTLVVTDYEDNSSNYTRTNDGFNPIELLGLCQLTILDILEQLKGTITPTVIERNVIK